jgi:hypothetical protein
MTASRRLVCLVPWYAYGQVFMHKEGDGDPKTYQRLTYSWWVGGYALAKGNPRVQRVSTCKVCVVFTCTCNSQDIIGHSHWIPWSQHMVDDGWQGLLISLCSCESRTTGCS